MTQYKEPLISGGKKSKKPKAPVKAAISSKSTSKAKLLLLLSEGEVEASNAGVLSAKDIYLDDVPIIDENGSENYEVKWEFLKGTQTQEHINSLPSVENYISVGLEIKTDRAYITNLTNSMLDQVRVNLSFPTLQQVTASGDQLGTLVEYAVDIATGAGAYVEAGKFEVNGRFTSTYHRTHEFDLQPSASGWRVRVRRITEDSDVDTLQNSITVAGITEVIDSKLRYPNSSLLFLEFDAESFPQLPKVSIKMKGKVVRVPDNYSASTKTYVGVWNGLWKWSYTNNPVWCLMDVLLSETYGLGERITISEIDKWGFYKIAQWCDFKVNDGVGGLEARHSLNVYLQKQVDAWRLVQDICSNFNGSLYWNGRQVEIYADIPSPIEYTYNTSNVVGGKFNDADIDIKNKYSHAIVSYDEPINRYKTDKIPVYDAALTRRFGARSSNIPAFGVTSRGEAQRKGKWALMANKFDRMTAFEVGLDGYIPRIGSLIAVANNNLSGANIGGRIVSVVGRKEVVLDRDCRVVAGDRITLNLPSGVAETKTIESVVGRNIKVTTNFSVIPTPSLAYSIDSDTLSYQTMRVLSSKQKDNTFTIGAIEYNASKQAYIDDGAYIELPPISITPVGNQLPPTNLTIRQYEIVEQGINITNVVFSWTRSTNAVYYEVQWNKDGGVWINAPQTSNSEVELSGVYEGVYQFRVRAISATNLASQYVVSGSQHIYGKVGAVQPLAFLRTTSEVMAVRLDWGFSERSGDSSKVVLQFNLGVDEGGAQLLSEVGYPTNFYTHSGLAHAKSFYYRGKVVDKLGNESVWSDWVLGSSSSSSDEILSYIDGLIGETQLDDFLQNGIGKIPILEAGIIDAIDRIELVDTRVDVANIEIYKIPSIQASVVDVNTRVDGVGFRVDDANLLIDEAIDQIGNINDRVDTTNYNVGVVDIKVNSAIGRVDGIDIELDALNLSLDTQIADIKSKIDQLETLENYDPLIPYLTGSLVKFNNTIYAAKVDVPEGVAPTNTTYWESIGGFESVNDIVAALSIRVNEYENRITEAEGVLTSTATKVDGIYTLVKPPMAGETDVNAGATETNAGVFSIWSSLSDKDSAMSKRVDIVSATVAGNKADITTVSQAGVAADEALGLRIDSVTSEFNDNSALVQSKITALVNKDESLSQSIDLLSASFEGNTSSVQTQITSLVNADTAINSRVDLFESSYNENKSVVESTLVNLANADTAQASVTQALSGRVDGVDGRVSGNTTAISSLTTVVNKNGDDILSQSQDITSINSEISTIKTDVVDVTDKADEALSSITTLTTTKADASALQTLDTKVTSINDTVVSQGMSILGINSSLTILDGRITTAQQTADDAQSDVDIVKTTKADASALQQLDTKVDAIGDDVTSSATAITKLQADLLLTDGVVSTKADNSALQSLTTRVGTVEGVTTLQGGAITALENSLVTVNTSLDSLTTTKADVSALQLLETKVTNNSGDIVIQSGAITSLQSALGIVVGDVDSLTTTKADASALQLLDTKVSDIDGVVTAHSTSILNLGSGVQTAQDGVDSLEVSRAEIEQSLTTLSDKDESLTQSITALTGRVDNADLGISGTSTALSSLTGRVDVQEGVVVIQGQDIVSLKSGLIAVEGDVDDLTTTKADASALSSLDTIVTEIDGRVVAQGQAIIQLNSNLDIVSDDVTDIKTNKADVTALQQLDTRVFETEGLLISQGSSITNIQNSLTSLTEEVDKKATVTALDTLTADVISTTNSTLLNTQAITRLDNSLITVTGDVGDLLTTKADVTALDSLTNIVSDWGDMVTVNGESILQLRGSLTTTQGELVGVQGEVTSLTTSKADASALQELDTKVVGMEGYISTQTEAITQLESSVENIGTRIDGVVSEVNTKATSSALSLLETKVTDIEGEVSVNTQAITRIDSSVDDVAAGVSGNSSAISDLEARTELTEAGVQSTAVKMDSIYTTIKPPMAGETDVNAGSEEVKSGVWSVWTSIAEGDIALANTVEVVTASVNNNTALIQTNAQTSVDLNIALSERIDLVTSEFNGGLASVEGRVSTLVTDTEALAQQLVTIEAEIEDDRSTVSSRITSLVDETHAISQHSLNLESTFNANSAEVQSQIVTLVDNTQSMAQTADILRSEFDSNVSEVAQQITTLTTDTQSLAQSSTDLSARLDTSDGNISGNSTAISDLSAIVVEVDGRVVTQSADITDLNSRVTSVVDGLITKADVTALQQLATVVTENSSGLVVQGGAITDINVEIENLWDANTTLSTNKADASALQTLDALVSEIDGEVKSQGSAVTALESSLVSVNNRVDTNVTDITAAQQAADNANAGVSTLETNKADASALQTLNTLVDVIDGKVSSTSQAVIDLTSSLTTLDGKVDVVITDLSTAQSVADSALAAAGVAQVGVNDLIISKADTTALQQLDTRVVKNEEDILSQGISLTSLDSGLTLVNGRVDDTNIEVLGAKQDAADAKGVADGAAEGVTTLTTTKADASALQQLETQVGVIDGEVTSQSGAITDISSSVELLDGRVDNALNWIWVLNTNKAESSLVNSLSTTVNQHRNTLITQANSISSVTSTANSAYSQVSTLASTQASTDGKLSSLWGVRMTASKNQYGSPDGSQVVAGIGLGIEDVNGVSQSHFVVQSDLFAVQQGAFSDKRTTVFAIQNGQVVIRDAIIGTAAITTAKIKDLAVDTLKIKGNAVTVPVVVETGNGVIPVSSFYMDYAGDVMIIANLVIENIYGNTPARAQIQINSNYSGWRDVGTTRFLMLGGVPDSQVFTAMRSIPAGSHLVRVLLSGHVSPYPDYISRLSYSRIITMGVKR